MIYWIYHISSGVCCSRVGWIVSNASRPSSHNQSLVMRFSRSLLNVAGSSLPKTSRQVFNDVFVDIGGKSVLLYKATGAPTGIEGFPQHPDPRPALLTVYDQTLDLIKTKYPTESVYRQSVENLTNARRKIVTENEITQAIEDKIGAGLIEEILLQAVEEFKLAEELAEQKPWEALEEQPGPGQWEYFDRP